MLGDVEHSTKTTFLGKGWGVRIFTNGEINSEAFVTEKEEIGTAIRSMLRMEDKCGNYSKMAHNSRMRPGIKANKTK
jgi:hypothetical protein